MNASNSKDTGGRVWLGPSKTSVGLASVGGRMTVVGGGASSSKKASRPNISCQIELVFDCVVEMVCVVGAKDTTRGPKRYISPERATPMYSSVVGNARTESSEKAMLAVVDEGDVGS